MMVPGESPVPGEAITTEAVLWYRENTKMESNSAGIKDSQENR